MGSISRLSPSSRLVLLSVVVALVLVAIAPPARRSLEAEGPTATSGPQPVASPSLGVTSAEPTVSPEIATSKTSETLPTASPTSTMANTPTPVATTGPSRGPTPTQSQHLKGGTFRLATVLAALPVEPERRMGYSRDLFRHWIDADGDGCDTRREVLIVEAVIAPAVSAGCVLSGGEWRSLYDGLTFSDPSDLDIDHVVALAEAWDSGAYGWDAAQRQAFANDLGVSWSLIAVSASSNRSKSDRDPADWLPPRAEAKCPYLADWVAVKARWGLAVDSAERSTIASQTDCEDVLIQVVIAD